MSKNGWNSPEANAHVKKEHDHAIMQAKVTLACACAEGGVFEKLGDLPYALYGELNNELGDANYRVLIDLIFAAPFLRDLVNAGGNR
jgi:hypothetical protein